MDSFEVSQVLNVLKLVSASFRKQVVSAKNPVLDIVRKEVKTIKENPEYSHILFLML